MSEEKSVKTPQEKFRVGQIVATIWKNDRKEGQDYDTFSITVEKTYLDKEQKWQKTSSMQMNDLPKVELACQKAYDYLATKKYAAE